jgi:membrane protein DedA with SNARE-associated domain
MDEFLHTLGEHQGIWAYLVLAVCAGIEYVFPPFPGDTVTLFGAFLITAEGWSAPAVLTAVTVGSLAGAAVDYAIGVGLARNADHEPRSWLGRYWHRAYDKIDPVVERLSQRGASYIVINRFIPGVRAFFFVAAGMAGLRLRAVMFYAAVSALLWNILIIAVGSALGASWERLRDLFQSYTTGVWILLAATSISLLIRWWIRRRRRSGPAQE